MKTVFITGLLLALTLPVPSGISARENINPAIVSFTSSDAASNSYYPGISSSGRYVTFSSDGANLVPDDSNGKTDIFIRDRQTNSIDRISIDSKGNQGNGDSHESAVSGDGRYVVFISDATNLIPGDTNGKADVFIRDRQAKSTTRISVDSKGNQGNGNSYHPCISGNGRYVAFQSFSSNLIGRDTGNGSNIFIYDRQTRVTTMISVDSAGNQGNGNSYFPGITSDGLYIAFVSYADNLVPGDSNKQSDVFIHDRQKHLTSRVSVDARGNQVNGYSESPGISGDGRYIAFTSTADNLVAGDNNESSDVFVKDLQTGAVDRVSLNEQNNEIDANSYGPSISNDGRYVAFSSDSPVKGNQDMSIILVRDLQTGTTIGIGKDFFGFQIEGKSTNPVISANGRYVAFTSETDITGNANALSNIFVFDLRNASLIMANSVFTGNQINGNSYEPHISSDGRYVAFSSDAPNSLSGFTQSFGDIYIYSVQSGNLMRAGIEYTGIRINGSYQPVINGDGSTIGFVGTTVAAFNGGIYSSAGIFVCDLKSKTVTIASSASVSQAGAASPLDSGNDPSSSNSYQPGLSDDGNYVAFSSDASNLVPNDTNGATDVFVYDLRRNVTTRVSVDSARNQGNGNSYEPAISADGGYVAFVSEASNLVPDDTNKKADIFLRDLETNVTVRVNLSSEGDQADNNSYEPSISGEGRYVVFTSVASNLVTGNSTNIGIFVRDLKTNTTVRVSVDSTGVQGNGDSYEPKISNNGRYAVFLSDATNLIPNDTNRYTDIFVHDLITHVTSRASVDSTGKQSDGGSFRPSISGDGRYIAFESEAINLVSDDTNDKTDIFIHDMETDVTTIVGPGKEWHEEDLNSDETGAKLSQADNSTANQSQPPVSFMDTIKKIIKAIVDFFTPD